MYRSLDGEEVFVIDCHTHLWDASPANQRNKWGRGWIDCFYAYTTGLSPAEYVWPLEEYEKYSPERMAQDLFVKGYVDVGILQSTYLKDFYYNGFNTTMLTAAATTAATPLSQPILLSPAAGYLQPNNDASPPDGTNARRLQLAVRFRF